jgi:hypothetical protein
MTATEFGQLQDLVLTWIREAEHPPTTSELLDAHRAEARSGEALRTAVWSLVDAGRARFDSQWRLVLVDR